MDDDGAAFGAPGVDRRDAVLYDQRQRWVVIVVFSAVGSRQEIGKRSSRRASIRVCLAIDEKAA